MKLSGEDKMAAEQCNDHSGCIARICSLENDTRCQWTAIKEHREKMSSLHDKIMSRINVVLGGIVVACVMLAINLVVRIGG